VRYLLVHDHKESICSIFIHRLVLNEGYCTIANYIKYQRAIGGEPNSHTVVSMMMLRGNYGCFLNYRRGVWVLAKAAKCFSGGSTG